MKRAFGSMIPGGSHIRGQGEISMRFVQFFCCTKQIMIQKKVGNQLPAEDPSTHHKKP